MVSGSCRCGVIALYVTVPVENGACVREKSSKQSSRPIELLIYPAVNLFVRDFFALDRNLRAALKMTHMRGS